MRLFEVILSNFAQNSNISLYFPCYQGKLGETGSLWTARTARQSPRFYILTVYPVLLRDFRRLQSITHIETR